MIDAAPRTRAVLFDLDGTLADTAPDLGAAVNRLRVERGLAELPLAHYRPWASAGARGLLRAGFGLAPGDPDYEPLRAAFLERYAAAVCVHTRLFPGNHELLVALAARGVAWGIVTNKATRFTAAIVAALGIEPACVVCGDTTPHIKPHPAPLLHAAGELGLRPRDCCYVGDDLRDVQAARAAAMRVVAVEFGYGGGTAPRSWNADAVIGRPLDLLEYL
jgi:2-phosphoglycolate phosphatase